MKGVGWTNHSMGRVEVVLWDHDDAQQRYVSRLELRLDDDGMPVYHVEPTPHQEEPPRTLVLRPDFAVALRDALIEATKQEPTRDVRVAALEAEVRVLREWLAAEREHL